MVWAWCAHGSAHFVAGKRGNHAFDLPPVAETGDIAVVAALLGPRSRLEAGIVAEPFNEVGCVGERDTAMDEWAIHGGTLAAPP